MAPFMVPRGMPMKNPKIAVLLPCYNEEAAIRSVVSDFRRVLPGATVFVYDNASTDRTGEILDRLAGANPQLNLVHLKDLPDGWLGKNHALQRGADQATGQFLLFTDADVIMHPTAVSRAISSNVSSSSRGRNSYRSPYISAGMQYGQRKLHLSVTEIRRSRKGRPNWSAAGACLVLI